MEEIFYLIFGAVLGSLLTFCIQNYYSMRAQDIAHLNDFLLDLDLIEKLSVEYWLIDLDLDDLHQENLAVRIRGAIHATSTFVDGGSRKLMGDAFDRFTELDGRLFDTATGGSFETKERKRSPDIVIEIMQISNEIRSLIRNARRKFYWFN